MNQRQRIRYALRAGGELTIPGAEAARPAAARGAYTCLVCGESLTLKAASSTKVTPYFSHAPASRNREGHAPESVIHHAAKARLMAALSAGTSLVALWPCPELACPGLAALPLHLPEHDEIRAEVGLEDTGYRLDVALRRAGRTVFAFEARHTHAVGETKARDLDGSVPWIEFAAEEFVAQGHLRVLDGPRPTESAETGLCRACAALRPSERVWATEALNVRRWLWSLPWEAQLMADHHVRQLEQSFEGLKRSQAREARREWFQARATGDAEIFEIALRFNAWGHSLIHERAVRDEPWGSPYPVGLGYVVQAYPEPALALRLTGRQLRALWWGEHRQALLERRLEHLRAWPVLPCPTPALPATGSWSHAATRHAALMRLAEHGSRTALKTRLHAHVTLSAIMDAPGAFSTSGGHHWISLNNQIPRIRGLSFSGVIRLLLKAGVLEEGRSQGGRGFPGLPLDPRSCPGFPQEVAAGEAEAEGRGPPDFPAPRPAPRPQPTLWDLVE
ncbi:competence protein CoiA family protein [Deinococcus sp. NW-56]|uniref:competence protein CoiA family protein n=1 Tax=Deinococcus sp. NW-56 TaxID=2080419 RepID=UPI000CF3B091|nr:competence protein CoiA family protein [Deinococcus sp. NW-56]